MSLREQWIRPLDALPQDYQHVIAITSSGQEEEMYLVDDKWHIVDELTIPIESVIFWHEKREQPTVEMAEDCISRKIVQQEIEKYIEKAQSTGTKDDLISFEELVIKQLPSVTPQPKRGKWEVIRKEYEFMGGIVNEPQGCKCSNCGGIVKFKSDFCPNCGVDMREGEE